MSRVGNGLAIGAISAFSAGAAVTSQSTRDSIAWAWSFFLNIVQTGPLGLWATLLGLVFGWLLMLWVRMVLPSCGTGINPSPRCPEIRRLAIYGAGVVGSVIPTVSLWNTAFGWWLGVTIGLAAPWSWSLVILAISMVNDSAAEKLKGAIK